MGMDRSRSRWFRVEKKWRPTASMAAFLSCNRILFTTSQAALPQQAASSR